MKTYQLDCHGRSLQLLDSPLLMGILNVTPDSFSDGGTFLEPAAAIAGALNMIDAGTDIIDIGGESTRPGSEPVSHAEQIKRVVPVIDGLSAQTDIPISIDTTSSTVAAAAIDAGASIINDISALRFDPKMAALAAETSAPVILMHMQGRPDTMQTDPAYANVIQEVKNFLASRIDLAVAAGIDRTQIVIDPGIGFGKTAEHNLLLLKNLKLFADLDVPLLVGPSRKSFIGELLKQKDPAERLWGTAAVVAWCAAEGAHIIRVHDVKQMAQVVRLTNAIRKS